MTDTLVEAAKKKEGRGLYIKFCGLALHTFSQTESLASFLWGDLDQDQ